MENSGPLRQIIYLSTASHPMTDDELEALLTAARKRNGELGVTGMLLYSDGEFLQALEGPPDALDKLLQSIRFDLRHCGMMVIADRRIAHRDFEDWSMAFRRLSGDELRGGRVRPGAAAALIYSFRKGHQPALAAS